MLSPRQIASSQAAHRLRGILLSSRIPFNIYTTLLLTLWSPVIQEPPILPDSTVDQIGFLVTGCCGLRGIAELGHKYCSIDFIQPNDDLLSYLAFGSNALAELVVFSIQQSCQLFALQTHDVSNISELRKTSIR